MVGVRETETGFTAQQGLVRIELEYNTDEPEIVFSNATTHEIIEEHEIKIVDSELSNTGRDIVILQGVSEYMFRTAYTGWYKPDCYEIMGWAARYAEKKLDRYIPENIKREQARQIEELLDQMKDTAHEMLKQAYLTGAVSEGTWISNPDNCVLPKLIVTLLCKKDLFSPKHPDAIKEMGYLSKFI